MCWLITIAIPISEDDPAGRREELLADERRLACDRRDLFGIVGALGAHREHREQQSAADPEDGDADVDELEDSEPGRAGVGRLEGEEEADADDGEEDGGSDPAGLARGSLAAEVVSMPRE